MTEKTKVQMMWEVSREQEEEFRKILPEEFQDTQIDDLFKLIRGSEYRRGKEDGTKEYIENVFKAIKEVQGSCNLICWQITPQNFIIELKKQITALTGKKE